MKTLRLLFLAFVLAIPARAQVHLLVTTNGGLLGPADFFTLNSNLIVAAIGGALGGGSGNASTNQTQAWAATNTQTFLGPVYFGTTNAVTELAGKQNADAQLDVVANLTSGTATNFLAGDGTFKQVTTNMVPGLVADILAAAAAGGGGDVTAAGTNNFTGPNSFAGTSKFTGLATLNGGWTPFTNNTRVVFEGDSLSTYIGNEGQTNWSKYITNHFPSLNLTAGTNAATSGQQISNMLADYTAQVQPYKPSGGTNAILFFWAGINDVYYTNYATALTRLTNYWAGAKADGFTLVGFTITDSTNLTAQTRANLPIFNNLIRQHAPLYCDYFVDVAELLNDIEDTTWATAGVHYTSRANEILAEHVRWTLLQGGFFHRRITGTRNYPDNSFRSLSFVSNAAPRAMVGGGLAFDADAHAAGRGALVVHDGTANAVVVAVQESDTPSNGQFPRWNTGGTITWETPTGTGDVVGPASATDSVVALYDGTTGKLLKNGTLTEAAINAHLTEAEASALYQRTNAFLTGISTGDGSALTNLNASNIASGTISSNRLPDAVSFTTLNAGTINATAVVGDASGLTGINATNITAGELADARIPAGVARTNAPTLHSPNLLTPSLGVATATSLTTGTLRVTSDFVQSSAPIDSSLGAAVVLDFKWPVSTFAATNNVIVLQSTNRPSAATNVVFSMLRITGDTVDRTISYPAAWKRLGTNITTIPSNKVVLVSGMCIGTAETGVTFGVAKEE